LKYKKYVGIFSNTESDVKTISEFIYWCACDSNNNIPKIIDKQLPKKYSNTSID
jgi:hypothetical protein